METLIALIEELKNSEIKNIIDAKMSRFSELGKKSSNEIFKELCFCLLTANFSASGGIKIQKEIDNGFLVMSEAELAKRLSELGHRFPNARAKFISEAQKHKGTLKKTLESLPEDNLRREWLVKNIKGLGMKESSHFLRNIGYRNVAIIDFHIVDLLVRQNLVEKPKSRSLTPKKYLEIESVLQKLCNSVGLCQGELDLYLWYEETGKILK
ncbi:MAG: N-glycosylase/DNA lyase [Nanoarchaeota archaeon]|nr:N-glycosylase/DNA lyase [Nanoarchaeota archaeon]